MAETIRLRPAVNWSQQPTSAEVKHSFEFIIIFTPSQSIMQWRNYVVVLFVVLSAAASVRPVFRPMPVAYFFCFARMLNGFR